MEANWLVYPTPGKAPPSGSYLWRSWKPSIGGDGSGAYLERSYCHTVSRALMVRTNVHGEDSVGILPYILLTIYGSCSEDLASQEL